jgi:hypothetical protein
MLLQRHRTRDWFESNRPVSPEPDENKWSNIFYGLAALPYLSHTTGDFWVFIMASLCFIGLIALCVGSSVYHRDSSSTSLLMDHIGMHLAIPAVAGFAVASVANQSLAGLLVWLLIVIYGCFVLEVPRALKAQDESLIDLPESQNVIAVYGGVLAAASLASSILGGVLIAACFGIGFLFHDAGHDTPTSFGRLHAVWHFLTALGLALPALL